MASRAKPTKRPLSEVPLEDLIPASKRDKYAHASPGSADPRAPGRRPLSEVPLEYLIPASKRDQYAHAEMGTATRAPNRRPLPEMPLEDLIPASKRSEYAHATAPRRRKSQNLRQASSTAPRVVAPVRPGGVDTDVYALRRRKSQKLRQAGEGVASVRPVSPPQRVLRPVQYREERVDPQIKPKPTSLLRRLWTFWIPLLLLLNVLLSLADPASRSSLEMCSSLPVLNQSTIQNLLSKPTSLLHRSAIHKHKTRFDGLTVLFSQLKNRLKAGDESGLSGLKAVQEEWARLQRAAEKAPHVVTINGKVQSHEELSTTSGPVARVITLRWLFFAVHDLELKAELSGLANRGELCSALSTYRQHLEKTQKPLGAFDLDLASGAHVSRISGLTTSVVFPKHYTSTQIRDSQKWRVGVLQSALETATKQASDVIDALNIAATRHGDFINALATAKPGKVYTNKYERKHDLHLAELMVHKAQKFNVVQAQMNTKRALMAQTLVRLEKIEEEAEDLAQALGDEGFGEKMEGLVSATREVLESGFGKNWAERPEQVEQQVEDALRAPEKVDVVF